MTTVLITSVVLQFTAAFLAFRLIKITGKIAAWSLISAAVLLQAVRRSIVLFRTFFADQPYTPDIEAELVALAISILVVVGIAFIAPIFYSIRRSKESLRKSEEKYISLFENVPVGIGITSLNGKVLNCNKRMLDITGYSLNELKNINISETYADQDERKQLIESLNETGSVRDFEVRLKQKDGTVYSALLNIDLTDLNGRKVYLTSKRDITKQKYAEEQLKASLEEKETLLKEIHHRVKNNFAIIISLLALQESRIKNEESAKLLKDINNRMRTMSLIHEKLHQSRDIKSIDFGDYIKVISHELFYMYVPEPYRVVMNTDVESIKLNVDQAIPCGLILNEILSNAFKYAFPEDWDDRGEILISLHEKDDNIIELIVADNGVGIPESIDIQKVNSLGLKLITMLTKQLNGEYELDRQNGTKFTIRFEREEI